MAKFTLFPTRWLKMNLSDTIRCLRHLFTCGLAASSIRQRGVAAMEFVFFVPVLAILIAGGAEYSRYLLMVQKVDKTAYAIGNIVTQYLPADSCPLSSTNNISVVEIQKLLGQQVNDLMQPYNFNLAGSAISVLSISRPAACGSPIANWVVRRGSPMTESKIKCGGSAICGSLPTQEFKTPISIDGLSPAITCASMYPNENIIVVEIQHRLTPLEIVFRPGNTTFNVPTINIYRSYYFSPRSGALTTLKTPPPSSCP